MNNFGNKLYQIVSGARAALFRQGELAQLTYNAFTITIGTISTHPEDDVITINYPVGLHPNNQTIFGSCKYKKQDFLLQHEVLAFHELAINGIIRLVTIIEALLGDLVRAVILKNPQKLGRKKQIAMEVVLDAKTLEEIHLQIGRAHV